MKTPEKKPPPVDGAMKVHTNTEHAIAARKSADLKYAAFSNVLSSPNVERLPESELNWQSYNLAEEMDEFIG